MLHKIVSSRSLLLMTKTIIVPTDFSENAWNALRYAVELHQQQECIFHIIHTHDMKFYTISDLKEGKSDGFSNEIERDKAEKQLLDLKQRAADLDVNNKHEFYTHFILNDLYDGLIDVLKEYPAQLIVMGTKGASNYRVKAFGSNTIKVLNDMRKCDVIAVPYDAHAHDCKEIVFSSDFKNKADIQLLDNLKSIAVMRNANVCLLYIGSGSGLCNEQETIKSEIINSITPAQYSFHELTHEKVYDGIRNFVESRNSDMISFINHEHDFFERIFSTSLATELGKFSKVPLLILQQPS